MTTIVALSKFLYVCTMAQKMKQVKQAEQITTNLMKFPDFAF